jgi:hypothetical protein
MYFLMLNLMLFIMNFQILQLILPLFNIVVNISTSTDHAIEL